jgi:hypothetical protein
MSVDGSYDCVTKSPMGDQKSVFTVKSEGDSFTGSNAGAMGALDVENGKVDGNKLTWTMNMKVPMPMTLECEATIDGDALTGTIKAGAFGSMAMTGTRQALFSGRTETERAVPDRAALLLCIAFPRSGAIQSGGLGA